MKFGGERVEQEFDLIFIGALLVVLGTLTTATGQTKVTVTLDEEGKRLIIKGNGVEGFGNTLQAIGRQREGQSTISIFGSWLQAGGNFTNSVATNIELEGEELEGASLNMIGSGIQSIGAALEAKGELEHTHSMNLELEVIGFKLISIGSLIDTYGDALVLKDKIKLGNTVLLVGAWIQVVGAIFVVLGLINK